MPRLATEASPPAWAKALLDLAPWGKAAHELLQLTEEGFCSNPALAA